MKPRDHAVVPDTQVKPGVVTAHLDWAGRYLAEKRPDVLVMLGDWWDMPSLSSYDRGKTSAEGRRYRLDIDAGNDAMDRFLHPLRKEARWWRKLELHFLIGNHEQRIARAADDHSWLEGKVGYRDLNLSAWDVHDFLEVVKIDGVSYSHYFPRNANGTITQAKRGSPSAKAQCIREGGSATSGHQQGIDLSPVVLGSRVQWGLIAGSFYLHDEGYLTPQGATHWKGLVVKHDVHNGDYCPMLVDMRYLRRKYSLKALDKAV